MQPFLRIPPFPGHRAQPLTVVAPGQNTAVDLDDLAGQLRAARVGGAFWGAQPDLPKGRDVLLAPVSQAEAFLLIEQARSDGTLDRCVLVGAWSARDAIPVITRLCDPWHLAEQSREVRGSPEHELALIAGILGKAINPVLAAALSNGLTYRDPFTGNPITIAQAITLLADWRGLIDANRHAKAIYGVARWKRVTMDALLWDGGNGPRHTTPGSALTRSLETGEKVLAWKSRTAADLPEQLGARGVTVGEIEDGMIRSTGLGANCVPPLSVIIDFAGAHFDPAQVSGLEEILQYAEMPLALLERAAKLRDHLVRSGISKYGQDSTAIVRPDTQQRRVLVTGQVEDDRSVLTGGAGLSNLEVIRRARAEEPDAWLIFKPHPDVEAGHRKGHVPDADALHYADEIDRTSAITTLIDTIDALHVITSLAGFEALMRGKAVTTHGVPFYAGWGLTRDLGPVPARRNRQRSLDELVAATLLLYPRYLDPVTRLPCPAEVLVNRMVTGDARITSPLVRLREAQGRLNLLLQRTRGRTR